MKTTIKLLILLALFTSCQKEDEISKLKEVEEDCFTTKHDSAFKNECRCLYSFVTENDSSYYEFRDKLSLYDYLVYQDSIDCGLVRPIGILSIIKDDVVLGGVELKCDC
jgi:hypothetical protein